MLRPVFRPIFRPILQPIRRHIAQPFRRLRQNPIVFSSLIVVKVLGAAWVFWDYAYAWASLQGGSMTPTFSVMGESVIVSRRHRHGRGVQVGDLVTYDVPDKRRVAGLKRVKGMPGDYVVLSVRGAGDGEVEGMMPTPEAGHDMMQVPQGHCWVEGDNQTDSIDSRTFGPLPLALVKGKAIATLFPFQWIENPMTTVEERPREASVGS